MYPNTWEDGHEHEWIENPFDSMYADKLDVTEVLCKLCGVPGEMDDDTKEVFWPAT
jgi:hypothetical protein